jgi:hypothetical protein
MFLSAAVTNKQLECVSRASLSTSSPPNSSPQNGLTCAAGIDHMAIIVNYEDCTQCCNVSAYSEAGHDTKGVVTSSKYIQVIVYQRGHVPVNGDVI